MYYWIRNNDFNFSLSLLIRLEIAEFAFLPPTLSIPGDPLHMKIKVIPVISAIKKSQQNQVFMPTKKQSMNVHSIDVTNAIIKQDGMSSF